MDTQEWITYFESNRGIFSEPDWKEERQLPEGEALESLRTSLATFQLGETGEGTTLQRYARKVSSESRFQNYDRALELFVDEEREHARLLAKTMNYIGGRLIQKQWTHFFFRNARRLINLEFEIQIFVTAEIIGKSYYALLHRHVKDPVIKSVCGKLICDEVKHLNFHIEFFRERLESLSPIQRKLWHLQFEAIFQAARHTVWLDHRHCLKNYGASRDEFMQRSQRGLRSFIANINSGRSLIPTVLQQSPAPL